MIEKEADEQPEPLTKAKDHITRKLNENMTTSNMKRMPDLLKPQD